MSYTILNVGIGRIHVQCIAHMYVPNYMYRYGKSDERKEEQQVRFVRNGGRKDVISGVGVKNGPVMAMA